MLIPFSLKALNVSITSALSSPSLTSWSIALFTVSLKLDVSVFEASVSDFFLDLDFAFKFLDKNFTRSWSK